jgi:hypothetical protein
MLFERQKIICNTHNITYSKYLIVSYRLNTLLSKHLFFFSLTLSNNLLHQSVIIIVLHHSTKNELTSIRSHMIP